jgi:hypothetical protein
LIAHDLFGKPLHAFPDHALGRATEDRATEDKGWAYAGFTRELQALKACDVKIMSALPETWLVHLIRMAVPGSASARCDKPALIANSHFIGRVPRGNILTPMAC